MGKDKDTKSKETKSREEEPEELTEEQRISMLEKSVSTNKVALLIVALLIMVALSVTITTTIVSGMSSEEVYVLPEELVAVQEKIAALEQAIAAKDAQLQQLTKDYPGLLEKLDASSAPTFQRVMVQQEASFQEFLKTMKSGMYDLAHMIPGSRTWLEVYNEQVNRAIQLSQNRSRDLKRLQTGEPLIEPDVR
ncbi:MAG: hypothetical protein H6998_01300 [Hahellaceae bacterium]|jgi:cell division protein FtsB|nr:hypothetical protein [Hahellaceae bacterium]